MNTHEEIKAIIWMMRHYQVLADSAWETYPDLSAAYLMYDHYLLYVKYYQDRLDAIFEG